MIPSYLNSVIRDVFPVSFPSELVSKAKHIILISYNIDILDL